MARSGIVKFHAMVVYTGQHPIVDTFIDCTFKNLLAPPRLLDILSLFFGGISQPGRVQWRFFPLADLAPGSRAIPPEVPEFSGIFIYSSEKFIYSSGPFYI